MKYLRTLVISLLAFGALGSAAAFAQGKTLAVPVVSQLPQTEWCWAASSQAVLSYTGNAPGMCNIVNWVRPQRGWGNANCCTNGTGTVCNQPNSMWGGAGSTQDVLSNWGADSTRYSRSLTLAETKKAIDDDSPVLVGWIGRSGGRQTGHMVVLHGYNGSNMTIMDPWNGAITLSHGSVVSTATRRWTLTLVVRPQKVTYVVDDTGSMDDEIASVRDTLRNQINGFRNGGRFVKYTLITYKDTVQYVGSTVDHNTITSWVNALTASGGGDCPEEGYGALDEAAARAPGSEIWWMTDADSHGSFLRMLQTRFRLWQAGCTLHSTILGACTSGFAGSSCQDDSTPYKSEMIDTRQPVSPKVDVSAFVAGEELSTGTGGLYFSVASDDIDEATEIIVEEISSTALLNRLTLSAGSKTTSVPVDTSVESLKITLDVRAGAGGSISVTGPGGAAVVPGAAGVREIKAGNSRMLILTPPALRSGTYSVTSSSSEDYFLSVSGKSKHLLSVLDDTTSGVGRALNVKVALPSLSPAVGFVGPGDDGPGGPLPSITPPPPDLSFDPADLSFFIEKLDGTGRKTIQLFDDGLHGDAVPNDGIFGGEVVLSSAGSFSLGATSGRLTRKAKLTLTAGSVSVSGPEDTVAAPGTTVTHTFQIENLSSSSRTFDLGITSSAGWADLSGLPATLTIGGGASVTGDIPVNVPVSASRGDLSVLSVTVAAQDDPTVTDSASVMTSAWEGPLLQSLTPTVVHPGDELTLMGTAFGSDPGAGNRSTNLHNVTIAGLRVADGDVLEWRPNRVRIRVPATASSGLIFLVADGAQSNELEVTVVTDTSTCLDGATEMCLNRERFLVEVDWRDFDGNRGSGRVVPFGSADSGLFYFFNPDNWEMLVKILNGCSITNHFWVFAAATTNVEYTLRVTDTVTGDSKSYFNPLGNSAAAITDTEALDSCGDAVVTGVEQVSSPEAPLHPVLRFPEKPLPEKAERISEKAWSRKACVISTISCNSTVNGRLTVDDCALDDGTFVDFWEFSGAAGTEVTINLTSNAFDAFLALFDPDTIPAAFDDDSGPGVNARIRHVLDKTGTWTIGANNLLPPNIGNYTLSLACSGVTGSAPEAPSNLTASASSASTIDLRWRDNSDNEDEFRVESKSGGGSFVDIGSVPANSTRATVEDLSPNTRYTFRIRARNESGNSGYSNQASATTLAPSGVCTVGSSNLCLNADRFRVEVDWKDFAGNEGSGQAVPGSDDSGLFWFFNSNNWEMLIKVLDGCRVNSKYWVFAAATTNVEYTLRITDTEHGVTRTYFNRLGRSASAITDTSAFATCP